MSAHAGFRPRKCPTSHHATISRLFRPNVAPETGSRTVGLQDEDGNAFDDRYTLNAKLGDGMTAVVYAATDRRTGRPCACKLAERKQRPQWPRLAQVLRHESALLQRLGEHPSIVRWQGMYRGSTQMALVLELVSGGDCQQLLQRHGCLAESAVHAMISQLRGALEHLHAQHVLHRDVKLENLLVNNEVWPPQIKLCDFGHACAATHAGDDDTEFYGTPGYAAPEVQSGGRGRPPLWSYAADVWAVGVVMYALLANALPFEREYSWLRPPDFSGRTWWQVSIEAKLLLQAVLESDPVARATLTAMRDSAWIAGRKHAAQQDPRGSAKPRPTLARRGYGSMISLGAHGGGGAQSPRPAGGGVDSSRSSDAEAVAAAATVEMEERDVPEEPASSGIPEIGATMTQLEMMQPLPEIGATMTQLDAMMFDGAPPTKAEASAGGEGGGGGSGGGSGSSGGSGGSLGLGGPSLPRAAAGCSYGTALDMLGWQTSSTSDEFFLDEMDEEQRQQEQELERQRLQKMRDALRECRMQGLRGSINAADAIRNRGA